MFDVKIHLTLLMAVSIVASALPAAGPDVLPSKVIEFSSQFNAVRGGRADNARAAMNLVDGNAETVWEVYNMKNNPQTTWSWVTLDLGSPQVLDRVHLAFVPRVSDAYLTLLRPREVLVAGSNTAPPAPAGDGPRASYTKADAMREFTVLCPLENIPPEDDGVTVAVRSSTPTRYVRVVFPAFPEGNPTLVLGEVEVFAAGSAPAVTGKGKATADSIPYDPDKVSAEIREAGYAVLYARSRSQSLSKDFEERFLLGGNCPARLAERPLFFFDVNDANSPHKKYGLMRVPALILDSKYGEMTFVYTKQSTSEDLMRFVNLIPARTTTVVQGE